jgi:hypothetical protein
MKYYQGRFKPKNPKKYLGDPTNIIYRSGWELKFMRFCDSHPNVIQWGSEEVVIPYISPIDGKVHRYFTDFIVKQLNTMGKKETLIIEVKPKAQTRPPEKKSRVTKRYLTEVKTWGVNQAKWKAANEFCKDRGWKFKIVTEDDLGIK